MDNTYLVTLVNINTGNTFKVDIVNTSAFEAQAEAEAEFEGYRVVRINRHV